jgi:hypothetical protein
LKPTKELAIHTADMLHLSALAPDEELDWNDVREIIRSEYGYQLDGFQTDLLTDWAHKIAVARLRWRRRRCSAATGKLLVL